MPIQIRLPRYMIDIMDKSGTTRSDYIRGLIQSNCIAFGIQCKPNGIQTVYKCSEVNDSNDIKESAKKLSTTPCGQIVDNLVRLYNTILCDLNQVKMITESRKSAINARWNEDKNRQNEGWWCEYYNRVKRSDFLMGRVSGDRVWRADFDWLIKPSNMVKVIEGRYDNKRGVDKYESAAELDPDEIMKSMFSRWDNIDNGGETKLLTAGEVDGQE